LKNRVTIDAVGLATDQEFDDAVDRMRKLLIRLAEQQEAMRTAPLSPLSAEQAREGIESLSRLITAAEKSMDELKSSPGT
jgi:hypothetical protein